MAEFNIKEWLANVAPQREQGVPQIPQGLGQQPPVEFPGQPQGGKNPWLKTFLPLLGVLAGSALMAREARPPDAPHGGTIGSKPALAQAYRTMAQAIEKKEQAKQLMEQEMYNRKRQAVQDAIARETFNIKKMLANLDLQKYAEVEKPLGEARLESTQAGTEQKTFDTEFVKKHGYYPGHGLSSQYPPAYIVNANKPEELKIPTTLTTYITPEGSSLYSEMVDAYNKATSGDRSEFDALKAKIKNAQGAMSQTRTSVNEFGQTVTTSGASDYSKLITLYDTYSKNLPKSGVKPTTPPTGTNKPVEYPADLPQQIQKALVANDSATLNKMAETYGEDVVRQIINGL